MDCSRSPIDIGHFMILQCYILGIAIAIHLPNVICNTQTYVLSVAQPALYIELDRIEATVPEELTN